MIKYKALGSLLRNIRHSACPATCVEQIINTEKAREKENKKFTDTLKADIGQIKLKRCNSTTNARLICLQINPTRLVSLLVHVTSAKRRIESISFSLRRTDSRERTQGSHSFQHQKEEEEEKAKIK